MGHHPVGRKPREGNPHDGGDLTAREAEIALYLASGRTNREIAAALEISIKTVDTHRGHLLKKLALRNNAELALYWVRTGRVTLMSERVDAAIVAHPVPDVPEQVETPAP